MRNLRIERTEVLTTSFCEDAIALVLTGQVATLSNLFRKTLGKVAIALR
jgi:hypothetical protein